MQIRKQLRMNCNAFARPILIKRADGTHVNINGPLTPEPNGYSGMHTRIRFKANPHHHGNATGQSKQRARG